MHRDLPVFGTIFAAVAFSSFLAGDVAAQSPSGQTRPLADWKDAGIVSTSASGHAVLRSVPIRAVTMQPGFWLPRMEANRKAAIPKLLMLLEEHGVVDNFRRLSGRKKCDRRGPLFTDSDLYKWMEAAALVLQYTDDAGIRESLDMIIDEVLATQGDDGYINTYFVDDRADKRWTRLGSDHELYCAGHLFQAAVAHYRATGSRKLLDGAIKFADYIYETFGADKKVQGHSGHPEIEMALVELYRTTGDKKYLDLCRYFLDHMNFADSKGLAGHAVRQMYICAGGVDYFAETGVKPFMDCNNRLWEDLVKHKMYVTGGVGARGQGEAFGEPFELGNYNSYAETCAGIGNAMWNWRMLAVTGRAKHADIFERVLYNGFLSGVSLGGAEYFYVNKMACDTEHRRQPWYGCTCCPPNVQRTIASIPGCMFSASDKGVYVHLYDNCELDWKLDDGTGLKLAQQTRYPWDGEVALKVSPAKPANFDLNLRIPGWCRGATVTVNGSKVDAATEPGSYCLINREWTSGDIVTLNLPMPVEAVVTDERVIDNQGKAALMRGPVVYCLEGVDNPGVAIDRVRLNIDSKSGAPRLKADYAPDLLNGVTVLRGQGLQTVPRPKDVLYGAMSERLNPKLKPVEVTAIPYYAWANREVSPMVMWINYQGSN